MPHLRLLPLTLALLAGGAGCAPKAAAPPAILVVDEQPAAGQRTFATAEEAVAALVRDVQAKDRAGLRSLFGAELSTLEQGNPVVDDEHLARFGHDLAQRHDLTDVPEMPGVKAVLVGASSWVFPVPLIQHQGRWFFDGEIAAREIQLRRIGANELHAIAVCAALAEAQREYFSVDRDGDGVQEYATRIASSAGQRDGLHWADTAAPVAAADGEATIEAPAPVGPALAKASGDLPLQQRTPYHGYLYRALRRQGPGAPGGARDFATGGAGGGTATGGFAFLAYPAVYGVTGVATFMVGADGVVYEFDLGPDTLAIAEAVELYDPTGWRMVDAQPTSAGAP